MADLTTRYMGMTLRSPIVVGSCGLTSSADGIGKLAKSGAAAVVLKSLFEEQILMEGDSIQADMTSHSEEMDYVRGYVRQNSIDEYLKLITAAKKAADIPIIASINCVSATEWTDFARKIQDAGADGLELNVFIMPVDTAAKTDEIEKIYFDIVKAVKRQVTMPIAIKISSYFTVLANMIHRLSQNGVDALVLFNRFHQPDIDIEKMAVTGASVFSSPTDNTLPLRWIGLMSGKVDCDLAASTGIHDGQTVVKNLLAGAAAVQVVSAAYQQGPQVIGEMVAFLDQWMDRRKFRGMSDLIGKLSYQQVADPLLYERSQFMKYFSNAK
jgi:dihydroorotate dehydrogenase (fumarate)